MVICGRCILVLVVKKRQGRRILMGINVEFRNIRGEVLGLFWIRITTSFACSREHLMMPSLSFDGWTPMG
jgi:hypothetical protein